MLSRSGHHVSMIVGAFLAAIGKVFWPSLSPWPRNAALPLFISSLAVVPLQGQTPVHVLDTESVITSLAVSSQRKVMAIGCEDGSILLQSVPGFELISNLHRGIDESWPIVCRIQFSSDGQTMLSEGFPTPFGPVQIWQLPRKGNPGVSSVILDRHTGGAISPNGKECADLFCFDDFECRVVDVHTRSIRATLPMPAGTSCIVTEMCYSPDGAIIAGAARDRKNNDWSVLLWDSRTFKLHRVIVAAKGLKKGLGLPGFPQIVISPRGRYVASIHAADKMLVWDIKTARLMLSADRTLIGAFSDDETVLATAIWGKSKVTLWDIQAGKTIMTFDAKSVGEVKCLAFTAAPNILIVAGARDTIETRLPFAHVPIKHRARQFPGRLITFKLAELLPSP
jgi:WD40 repeat protein